ncbi:MAG: biotin--[acetyl-CoA-carboxylase] ligase [Hyphococcus sp.]|nr:MAG: biotin--[acetyl-CoA-carboxylase] ligase [Marinicaulis sp.]
MRFPSGATVDIFETLDSTSLEARRRLKAGLQPKQWIIAKHQTAGYGRRNRSWEQATGDFAGTLVFSPEAPGERLGQLSFVIALGVASALDEVIKAPEKLTLKWPNDILIEGGKAAGLLLERIDQTGGPVVAIGVGVNIVSAPQGLLYPTARLVDFAATAPSPEALAERIDHHFWVYYDVWLKNGFDRIRIFWLERAAGIGGALTVRLPNEELSGTFEGIDETGALMLQIGSEKRIISAGDVFFEKKN